MEEFMRTVDNFAEYVIYYTMRVKKKTSASHPALL